jgi:hypothetical protein
LLQASVDPQQVRPPKRPVLLPSCRRSCTIPPSST